MAVFSVLVKTQVKFDTDFKRDSPKVFPPLLQAKFMDPGKGPPAERLCRNSVHGSTGSPRTDPDILIINHLAVRPELVEGPAANCDIVSGVTLRHYSDLSAYLRLLSSGLDPPQR